MAPSLQLYNRRLEGRGGHSHPSNPSTCCTCAAATAAGECGSGMQRYACDVACSSTRVRAQQSLSSWLGYSWLGYSWTGCGGPADCGAGHNIPGAGGLCGQHVRHSPPACRHDVRAVQHLWLPVRHHWGHCSRLHCAAHAVV
ncbi:hypothetical protein HaLaN_21042 [Haematococcus lacustris]|uniref:Uncharacterized protein n=1 Tax=Haematococcus lacustris TaxID=44745 RepID=A0A699ZMN8_HAELA|nr:hypothetical protein HaLaN_21042 [Haematococcus lacustris]